MQRKVIVATLFGLIATAATVAADSLPDPEALRSKAQEKSSRLDGYRQLMNDPDPNVKIEAFKALYETQDPALRKIAFDIALTSADPVLRNMALKYKIFSMNQLMLNWDDGARTSSVAVDPKADLATGNFRIFSRTWQSARVIGDRVEFDGIDKCSGALEFDGDRRLVGELQCQGEQAPIYIVIR